MATAHPDSKITFSLPVKVGNRTEISYSLGLNLDNISEAESCPIDGGRTQREWLLAESIKSDVTIFGDGIPGYGCVECPLKLYDPRVGLDTLKAEAGALLKLGRVDEARSAFKELRFQRHAFKQMRQGRSS